MINKNTVRLLLLFIVMIYIFKYDKNNLLMNTYNRFGGCFSIIFIIILSFLYMRYKKESFSNYPEIINESIVRGKYENINKEIQQQNIVFSSNSYHENKDMYGLDYDDVRCHPLEVPTTFYNKK